jgi:hypothetical protein
MAQPWRSSCACCGAAHASELNASSHAQSRILLSILLNSEILAQLRPRGQFRIELARQLFILALLLP